MGALPTWRIRLAGPGSMSRAAAPVTRRNSPKIPANATAIRWGTVGSYCEACHGSPHAILPSIEPNDNIQNIALQGHAGTLSDCTVCHATVPDGAGPHGINPATQRRIYLPLVLR